MGSVTLLRDSVMARGSAALIGLVASLWVLVGYLFATEPGASVGKLLSRNATYTVAGGGYVYSGQIQPGVNERAVKDGIVLCPLVEPTDSGDELIDGDRSDASNVYTAWFWNQPGKVIEIEMTLPGPSTVRRVRVTFPEDTIYRPESVRLGVRGEGEWRELGRNFVHRSREPVEHSPRETTFELEDVHCEALQFSIGGSNQWVGITEIEVWGEGPVDSERRGLIRAKPHAKTVMAPETAVPKGAVRLSGEATIQLKTSHDVSEGKPANLIDGERGSGIRIATPPHQHIEVTATLDLGDAYHIDAVHIWMPGGRGAATGHVHEVTLAVSPSADQRDWSVPSQPLVPVWWPTDDAPRPYVIPAGGLDVAGRRVRVHAYLSGLGGLTSVLSLGEIEVLGRPLTGDTPVAPRLELKPVVIAQEPVEQLAPRWQELRRRRIRGIWIGGDLDDPFGDTEMTKGKALADAGFNTVVLYNGVDLKNRSTAPQLADRIARNVAEAHRYKMLLLGKWQFGSTHEEPYRRFRQANGVEHDSSCCPAQPDYIERHVGRWAVRCAELGADGFTFDTEMYESDSSRYPSACFCDSCFRSYLKVASTNPEHHAKHIAAADRGEWIAANDAVEHYARHQQQTLIQMFDRLRARCRAVNPDFLLAYAPFVGYLRGMTHGLGTPERPVLVWSEREYTHGPESRTVDYVRRIDEGGLPAFYVGGHMLWYQDPETLSDNLVAAALHTDGWWAWYGTALLTRVGKDDPEAFQSPYGRAEGTTALDYLNAIRAAHNRLDALLKRPRDEWPRSELFREMPRGTR